MTISEYAEENDEIILDGRIYREKVFIRKEMLRIVGKSTSETIISFNDYADKSYGDDNYGTFRSYTAYFGCDSLICENLSIENTAGDGQDVGQAVAAYIDCRKAYFKNVRFCAHQDTIFITPLPEKPVIPNSFKGPSLNKPRLLSEAYFENCYIQGNIDFIFGGGTAVFDNCHIHCLSCKSGSDGFICAPSTDRNQEYGFIFKNCRIDGEAPYYLARPWREFAKAAFIDCDIDPQINPLGWDYWDNESNKSTVTFYETAKTFTQERAKFAKCLTDAEKYKYSLFCDNLKRKCLER